MSRTAAATERVIVLLVGLVLLAAGAAALSWQQGWLSRAPDRLDASTVLEWSDQSWWPWAVAAVGLLLVGLGLSWLSAHARRRTITLLQLTGSDRSGQLSADSDTVVRTAIAALDSAPGLTTRGGRIWRDQDDLVAELRAGLDPGADLDEAVTAAERAATVLRIYLGLQTPAHCRVMFVRGGRKSKVSRVR